jgi:hypothetical protein
MRMQTRIKKLILLFIITFISFGYSQQLEFGFNVGYGFTNIANSKITEGRAVIGDALWNVNKGFSFIYYFNAKDESGISNGIHFEFLDSRRGSKSETIKGNEYNFNAKSLNLNYRFAGSLKNTYKAYMDLGLGYNIINNKNVFIGNTSELVAFEKISEPLLINDNEITFLFAFGVDKQIFKNKFLIFIEFNGDAGISKINRNLGSFRTQSLGFSTGIKYKLDLNKK